MRMVFRARLLSVTSAIRLQVVFYIGQWPDIERNYVWRFLEMTESANGSDDRCAQCANKRESLQRVNS
jgi:hypothetical protein